MTQETCFRQGQSLASGCSPSGQFTAPDLKSREPLWLNGSSGRSDVSQSHMNCGSVLCAPGPGRQQGRRPGGLGARDPVPIFIRASNLDFCTTCK